MKNCLSNRHLKVCIGFTLFNISNIYWLPILQANHNDGRITKAGFSFLRVTLKMAAGIVPGSMNDVSAQEIPLQINIVEEYTLIF